MATMTAPTLDAIALSADEGPVALALQDAGARFNLRIASGDVPAASAAFGVSLPERIGARARQGEREALCVGPDEWLLYASGTEREAIVERFAEGLGATPHSLTDISDRELTITLSGPRAAELLSIGCAIDLDGLAQGDGTRTVFDGVTITLRRDGAEAFKLEAWRSFIPHVRQVLTAGNRELAAGL